MNNSNRKSQENILVSIIYATAAYFGFKYIISHKKNSAQEVKSKFSTRNAQTGFQNKTSNKATKLYLSEQFPLKIGMKGSHIATIQASLNLRINGIFDEVTEAYLLQYFGTASINQQLYNKITNPISSTWSNFLKTSKPLQGTIIKKGSSGYDVYRLQKWLGFKDRNQENILEPIADAIMGNQTISALRKKTGKSEINTAQLNQFIIHG